jgi:hypothetical protein
VSSGRLHETHARQRFVENSLVAVLPLALAAYLIAPLAALHAADSTKPNIVIILAGGSRLH